MTAELGVTGAELYVAIGLIVLALLSAAAGGWAVGSAQGYARGTADRREADDMTDQTTEHNARRAAE